MGALPTAWDAAGGCIGALASGTVMLPSADEARCPCDANSGSLVDALVAPDLRAAADAELARAAELPGSGSLRMVDGASGRGKCAANCSLARSTVLPDTSS